MKKKPKFRIRFVLFSVVVICSLLTVIMQIPVGGDLDDLPSCSHAKVYQINWDDRWSREGIFIDGEINPSRLPLDGIAIDQGTLSKLASATKMPLYQSMITRSSCHRPHHAIVFYDKTGDVVGHMSICFMCRTVSAYNIDSKWDIEKLRIFIQDLGIPIWNSEWD